MENLTKENFWNELEQKYPKGLLVFCNWIDDYKKKNNWNILFNDGVREHQYIKGPVKHTQAPKFNDLPLAMQIGIYIEFASQLCGVHEWEIEDLASHDWKADITACLKMLHDLAPQTEMEKQVADIVAKF